MTSFINASTSSGVVITPDNSGAIALQNAGTTGLNIDASGRVTMPLQPGFSAGRNAGTVTGLVDVVYNVTSGSGFYNTGAYNSSTGVFTAPVTGVYLMHLQATSDSTTTVNLAVNINGTAVASLQSSNGVGAASYSVYGLTKTFYLTAGNTVNVTCRSGAKLYGADSAYDSFGLRLLG